MIREKINTERLAQGFSVRKLARLCDMGTTQFNNFLKGKKTLNSDNIEKLFEVLKLEVTNIKSKNMSSIVERNGHTYSKLEFEGYKNVGIFNFISKDGGLKIYIFTTNQNKLEVLELLNKKKKECVTDIIISSWETKEEFEKDDEWLFDGL